MWLTLAVGKTIYHCGWSYGIVVLKGFLGQVEEAGEELFSGFDTVIVKVDDDGMRKVVVFLKNELLKRRDATVEGIRATVAEVGVAAEDTLIQLGTEKELWESVFEVALEYKQQSEEKCRLVSLLENENASLKEEIAKLRQTASEGGGGVGTSAVEGGGGVGKSVGGGGDKELV